MNAAVEEFVGKRWTAKDLWTWSATVLAAGALAGAAAVAVPAAQRARARLIGAARTEVAEHLGSTRPSPARPSSIRG